MKYSLPNATKIRSLFTKLQLLWTMVSSGTSQHLKSNRSNVCITAKPTSEFALAYYLRSSAILRQQQSFNLVNMVRQVRKGGYAALSMSETNFPEILSMTDFFLGSSRTSFWMTSSSAVAKRTTFLIKWILNYQDSICTCVLNYI